MLLGILVSLGCPAKLHNTVQLEKKAHGLDTIILTCPANIIVTVTYMSHTAKDR